ncbi:MAG: two-component regulator propeller domain-containing protein [Bacteroidota bacterium]
MFRFKGFGSIVVCAALILVGGREYLFGGVGDWHTFTAKRNIRGITVDPSGVIWAATDGGMFSYTPATKSFAEYTTSEGLQTTDLTAIISDQKGHLWIGASNGLIHFYDPRTRDWQYITDISTANSAQRGINKFKIIGDTLFILSDYGVSKFSISNMQFGDTYQRFGPAFHQLTGGVLAFEIFNGRYWVGTRNGLASTLLTNPNPSVPESWQTYDSIPSLISKTISGFALCADSFYIGTSNGLISYSGGSWNIVNGTTGLTILDVTVGIYPCPSPNCNTRYPFFVTSTDLWRGPGYPGTIGIRSMLTYTASTLTTVAFSKSAIVGTQNNGMLIPINLTWNNIFPAGPQTNSFVGIVVDNNGVLWSGTGKANGQGFMSYNGSNWKSYSAQQYPQLGDDNYYKVSLGSNNSKWISNWGQGVVLVNSDGVLEKVFNTNNGLRPAFPPGAVTGWQTYVVVGGVAVDRYDSTFITNRTPPGDTTLVIFHPDSSISYLTGLTLRTNPITVFTDVVVDQNNTKWFANFNQFEGGYNPIGLYFYNKEISLPGTVNGWGKLTTDDGLTSNSVWSIAQGQDGEIWIGTDQGISIMFYPQDPQAIAIYHPLPDQTIQAMLTDPLNNKWVATEQGVFVLSSDGTAILDHYTVAGTNGKLLSDNVNSLALDAKKGIMYFGTERGLSSLATAAIVPKPTFETLAISPNPFFLPSPVPLTVDGLVQGSSLKVLTSSGELVKDIQTPGGRVGFWDGLDGSGSMVASGVYLIIASSQDGKQVAVGKVAVLRK